MFATMPTMSPRCSPIVLAAAIRTLAPVSRYTQNDLFEASDADLWPSDNGRNGDDPGQATAVPANVRMPLATYPG